MSDVMASQSHPTLETWIGQNPILASLFRQAEVHAQADGVFEEGHQDACEAVTWQIIDPEGNLDGGLKTAEDVRNAVLEELGNLRRFVDRFADGVEAADLSEFEASNPPSGE